MVYPPETRQRVYIPYAETGFFSKLVLDYLEGKVELASFYTYRPELSAFKAAIAERKKHPVDRQTLVTVLKEQYKGLKGASLQNIEALALENTFTVTTGHQLNLFTGPLYFIYKILTTVRLSEELKKEYPEYHFVPVYWMATEDHDFAEINHTHVFGKNIEWKHTAKGATGRLSTESLASVLAQVREILGSSEQAQKLSNLLEESYLQQANLAAATRYLVNALFEEYGLVCVDADHPALKKQFASIATQDIIKKNSYRLITETNLALEKQYSIQVNPREINFFYLDEQLRERIIEKEGLFEVNSTPLRFTLDELKKQIAENPEKISPNVVMRPLYQEKILPNLAYIGGGAEVAYWMELKSTFEHYGVFFPMVILRNSVQWIDENSKKRMDKLGLTIQDLFLPIQELTTAYIQRNQEEPTSIEQELVSIEQVFKSLLEKSLKYDPSLKGNIEAEKTKVIHSLKHLEQKITKAEKKKYEVELSQLEKLKEKLFPNKELQERQDNVTNYLSLNPLFIKETLDALKLFNNSITIIL